MLQQITKAIVGLVLVILGLLLLTYDIWYMALLTLIQGGVVLTIFIVGLGLVLLGLMELKEN